MELYLQFGYGMMEHCRQLVQAWKGGTVVLSPRDLNDAQLERLSREVVAVPDGRVLVDPQFYLPNADHDRLVAHDYWPNDYASDAFFDGTGLTELIRRLLELNRRLSTHLIHRSRHPLQTESLRRSYRAVFDAVRNNQRRLASG